MDFWRSEYEEGNSTSSVLAGLQEFVDSPNVSRDSVEYSSDDPTSITSDPAEPLKIIPTPKASFLAKKRLQAYSAVNKFKTGNAKDEKEETSLNEKPHKAIFKKLKKTVYPDDAAKAVIRDIEILKRAGFGGHARPPSLLSSVPADIIPVDMFVPISLSKLNIDKSPTISLCSDMDEENLFKKREIKCRNIRKSATSSRRSASPKNSKKSSKPDYHKKKEKKDYPLNWTEYKELNLNPQKDSLLKSKLFTKPRSKHFSFKKYFNFELPPAPIEIFKCQPISGDASWIPFPYIRSTACRPQILYSTNQHCTTPGYLSRKQLFSIIPTERKAHIEKLWKAPSRCQFSNKKNTTRKWYPRNWKKFDNTEAKLLEKSVGLSFLQSYSDEGEEEEEETWEDNNEEPTEEKEMNLTENIVSTSPSATPKEHPKSFDENIQEDYKDLTTIEINKWDEPISSQYETVLSAIVKTPPIEEKEEGEISKKDNPRAKSDDEYQKTKKELASLEKALKETSITYVDNIDKEFEEKIENNTKQKKRKNNRSEKESKLKNKKNKSKKNIKKKSRAESEDDDSSELENETSKRILKKKKKHIKDKADKKEKRRKAKKKRSKKEKEEVDSCSESEYYEVESDIEENISKKQKRKKKKSNDKSKKGHATEELSGKVHDRKSSVDITHEGYEDDVKFFTARFDTEDDLEGKVMYKREDYDMRGRIQKKNKTNIDLAELTIPLKSDTDKTTKRKSKWEGSESDDLQKERCRQKEEDNIKQSNDRNNIVDETVKSNELKEERKKDKIKVDLLKKNEEYLREQDKLKLKQKKTSCDNTSTNLVKTPDTSIRSEDESSGVSKSQKLDRPKNKETQSIKSDITSEPKEKDEDQVLEKFRSPKEPLKDLETIKSSGDDLNVGDKKQHKKSDITSDSKIKQHVEHTESKKKVHDIHDIETKNRDSERHHKRDQIRIITNVVAEKELPDNCLSEHRENEDSTSIQKQPNWEQLKNKRKRHISDTFDITKQYSNESEELENAEMFPLEKDLPIIYIKQEKDSDNEVSIMDDHEKFQSNEDAIRNQNKSKQINTSWETDEEIFVVEKSYCSGVKQSTLNLEIPLNIKHFPRREIKVENDASDENKELRQLQKHSRDLSAERKKLEIEKKKVKDLERELLHVQEKELQQKALIKPNLKIKRDEKETTVEFEVQTPTKKRRWDIKSLDSTISTPKIKMEIFDVDASTPHKTVTLENEYEEFLKAVTSAKKDSHMYNTDKPILIDSSSDSSVTLNEGHKSKQQFDIGSTLSSEETSTKNSSPFRQVITNLDDLMPKPKETSTSDIPTLQIPLPPVKPEEIKPVPVPLPKLEAVFDLNKPLINLSLSANVTQNITLSLATSATSISAPVTSTIDISKTSFEITTPVSKNTMVSMNNIPLPISKTVSTGTPSSPSTNQTDLKLMHIPVPFKSEILSSRQIPKGETSLSKTLSGDADQNLDSNYSLEEGLENISSKQKIMFATLTLPSKKQLINNSNLNLDDSDNDDQAILEEMKRKKLEALIEDNKKEVLIEETNKQVVVEENTVYEQKPKSPLSNKQISKGDSSRKISPHKSSDSRRELSPRRKRESPIKRRDSSPKRRSPRRRSPRRSPRRRSPIRKRSPLRRRSPGRRSVSPRKRRSVSPRKRRSPSPRRKRSISPKSRQSPRRHRSISPKNKNRSVSPRSKSIRHSITSHRNRSPKSNERKRSPGPQQMSSPFGGLKRSVADSTISDDQLPQSTSHDDYSDHLFSNFRDNEREQEYDSPKREPLDVRISQVLGYDIPNEASPKPTCSTTFNYDNHQQLYQYSEQYSSIQSQVTTPTMRNSSNNQTKRMPQSYFRQVGNMLQIVPNDDIMDIPMPHPTYQATQSPLLQHTHQPAFEKKRTTIMDMKPQILQVGNMLQIVPTEMVPTEMIPVPPEIIPVPPTETEVKIEKTEDTIVERPCVSTSPDKPSAEASMLQKIAERRTERENRRHERERRRKEKEKRNKEKEKAKQAKMKIKTENMIKKALEMEQEEDVEGDISAENVIQWPPIPIVVAHTDVKEAGKSILLTSGSRKLDIFFEERKRKVVQFADGIKPGEGTSPSAGEELFSPPPPKKKLPKEKRYKKMKFGKKSAKKKVKVKIIKKLPSPLEASDSDDNLPPPSPPPGSPPPHIFPPRIKINPVNNVPAAYLATIIQNAQQQQHQQQVQQQQQQQLQQQQLQQQRQQYQSNIYCPPISLLMAPPPPPQGHMSTIPSHHQSPHGTTVPPAASPHGQQSHFHSSLPPPPPPAVSPHNHYSSGSSGQSGHHRHY